MEQNNIDWDDIDWNKLELKGEKQNKDSQKNTKKTGIIIAAVLLVLAAAIGMLVFLNDTGVEVASGSIAVISDGVEIATFDGETIQGMEQKKIKKHIVSGNGETEDGTFQGVEVRDLLTAAGVVLSEDTSQIVVRAEDGYTTAFGPSEIQAENNVYLVWAKDGKALPSKADGGNGPLRIIVADDPYGMRCAKYVNIIEVQ